jgi:hypothetical protein
MNIIREKSNYFTRDRDRHNLLPADAHPVGSWLFPQKTQLLLSS